MASLSLFRIVHLPVRQPLTSHVAEDTDGISTQRAIHVKEKVACRPSLHRAAIYRLVYQLWEDEVARASRFTDSAQLTAAAGRGSQGKKSDQMKYFSRAGAGQGA